MCVTCAQLLEPRTGDPDVSRSWSFIESFIFLKNACFLFYFLYDVPHLRPKYQVDVVPSHLLLISQIKTR